MSDVQVYSRREFVGDIRSATTQGGFRITRVATNPTTSTFPFLSQLSGSYEHYQFKSLSFYFRPTTNENTTTTQVSLGTTTMYFCYDALEPIVSSRNEANNYQGAKTARICDPLSITVKVPRNPLYLRSIGTQSIDTDIRESDFGYLAIATENVNSPGIPTDGVVGELWVTYTVGFWKPKIQDFIGAAVMESTLAGIYDTGAGSFVGTNAVGIQPQLRQWLVDNFNGMSITSTESQNANCFNILLRRGQIVEVYCNIRSDTPATGVYSINVTTTANNTGRAVAQEFFPVYSIASNQQIITGYIQGAGAALQLGASQGDAVSYWKCTQDGFVNFLINSPNSLSAISTRGILYFRVRLVNRPDFMNQLPQAQRSVTWFQPS